MKRLVAFGHELFFDIPVLFTKLSKFGKHRLADRLGHFDALSSLNKSV